MENVFINKISAFLNHEPIEKAWIFGSYSRNEEEQESDIDLMVKFVANKKITLLYYLKLKNELEELTGKSIDLVEEGQLKDFALPSFKKDKILIYERKN